MPEELLDRLLDAVEVAAETGDQFALGYVKGFAAAFARHVRMK